MKNLKKTLAVVSAIAVMLASVPAFAAVDLSYKDAELTTFTCTGEDTANPTVTAGVDASIVDGGEVTFIVLDADANESNVAQGDILYIDQKTASTQGTSFTGAINLARVTGSDGTALPDGNYIVKIGYKPVSGGDFAIARGLLKVGDSTGTTIEILWGDVNQDGSVNVNDSTKLLNWIIGGSAACGDYTINTAVTTGLIWGDVNQDSSVNVNDSTKLLNWIIGGSAVCGDYTINTTANVTIND